MQKCCTRCGRLQDLDAFYPKPTAGDGRVSRCKACLRELRAKYRQANRERLNRESAAWRAAHPGRQAQLSLEWRKANPERVREYRRAYEAEHAEACAERKHRWYLAHRDQVLAVNATPERRAQIAQWAKEHPAERAAAEALRRARIRATADGPLDLRPAWTGECGICRQTLDEGLPHPDPFSPSIDHVIPLSRQGRHELSNLQWAHLVCNLRKAASLPEGVILLADAS